MTGSPTVRTWNNQSYSGSRSITFRAIETNHNNISVIPTGGNAINMCGSHGSGINGTFYYMGEPSAAAKADGYKKGHVYRISVQGGAAAHSGGLKNRLDATSWGNCGTVLCYNNTLNSKKMYCLDMKDFDTAYIGNTKVYLSAIKWGIGGSNLYLDQSLTQTAFQNAISIQDPSYSGKRHRTAILIDPNAGANATINNVILLTAFWSNATGATAENTSKGITLWELRQFCQSKYPNYVGISLDGGGSTAISYLQLNPLALTFVHSGTSSSGPRLVPTMISTEMPDPI